VPARIPSAGEVQAAVNEVFSRPEYQQHFGFRDWIREKRALAVMWLLERIGALAGLRLTHPVIFWPVVGWMVVALLALLGHLVWSTVQATRRSDETATPGKLAARARPRGFAEWEAEAARLAAEGHLREAAAALYQALLLRLDAGGAVRFDPSKTPGDYRREARPHPQAARTLGSFLRLFEPVAFGGREVDGAGWERLRSAARVGGGDE
jgi:hypothetical protein